MKFGQGHYDLSNRSYQFDRKKVFTNIDKSLFIGLPQWGSPEWKGIFYNQQTRPQDFLKEYSKVLDCVEVSSSFYAPIPLAKVDLWKEIVPESFKFLPKWPKAISHDSVLNVSSEEIKMFVESMQRFNEKLGTTILQLPPSFSIEYKRSLFLFLEKLPQYFPVAIEFRHSSWFDKNRVYSKLEGYLASKKIGMVCSDTPSFPELCNFSLTGDNFVIRYGSDEILDTDQVRLRSWAKWLNEDELKGNIYFVLHRPDNSDTPNLIPLLDDTKEDLINEVLAGPQQSLI